MDLGADTLQTFRYVTFPVIRTALIAGGLLAFALSFDEVIVTTFTAGTQETIPIWIFEHIKRANQLPVVNAVAVFLILLSNQRRPLGGRRRMGPCWAAARATSSVARGRGRPVRAAAVTNRATATIVAS